MMAVQDPRLCIITDGLCSSAEKYTAGEVGDLRRLVFPFEAEERESSTGSSAFFVHNFCQFQILDDKTDMAMQQQLQTTSVNGVLDGKPRYDIELLPLQTCIQEITKLGKITDELQGVIDATRSPVLVPGEKYVIASKQTDSCNLSTVDILRAAVAKFQSFPMKADSFYQYMNSAEVRKNVHRIELLLAAANMVETGRFTEALGMLSCDKVISYPGNPIETTTFYFSKALRETIHQQTMPGKKGSHSFSNNIMKYLKEATNDCTPPILAQHRTMPFCQIQQICSAQIVEEHVVTASRIHIIDLAIRCGVQWVPLMQALAARRKHPVKLLKITAIGSLSEGSIENTGERLELFARSLNLPFKFKMIMSSEIDILNEDLIGIEEGESVVICALFALRIWIPWPDQLESLMTVIKRINPCVMVVNEVDWDFSSPSLFSRFKEALFYFGSYFDCLNDCMDREDNNRMIFELMFLGRAIKIIMEAEEAERTYTSINIAAWRALFSRFRMAEVDLSEDCLHQADVVKNNFKCGSSCTLNMDGKSLIIGWKGVPMHFISAWRFK